MRLLRLPERGARGPFVQKPFVVNPWKQRCRNKGLWCCCWRTGSSGNLPGWSCSLTLRGRAAARPEPGKGHRAATAARIFLGKRPFAARAGAFGSSWNVPAQSPCRAVIPHGPAGAEPPRRGNGAGAGASPEEAVAAVSKRKGICGKYFQMLGR